MVDGLVGQTQARFGLAQAPGLWIRDVADGSPAEQVGVEVGDLLIRLAYHQTNLGGSPWHVFALTVPVLFGWRIGPNEFVFGPRVMDTVLTAEGQNTLNTFWGGGSVGFAGYLGKKVYLMPEIVLMYNPMGFNGEVHDPDRTGLTMIQGGLTGRFGL